ncbi:MAG: hypothetical protein ACRDKT_13710 [Actinomycetota bacterium]
MSEERGRSHWASRSVPIWVVAIALALPWMGDGAFLTDRARRSDAHRVARTDKRIERRRSRARRPVRAEPVARERIDLSAYRGLGSWIDIYNEWPWDHPQAAINSLHRRGVKTIFLQTSNYGAGEPIFRPLQAEKFIHAAHRKDMKVVAWYVPSFAHPKVDRKRSLAPVRFKTSRGHRFDSFGMDIEATVVDRVTLRNKRFLKLSKWLRWKIGDGYPLGAITPDPVTGLYWPRFPYERTRRLYDVFVPMGYFSFRVSGYRDVKRYTSKGIRTIRRETHDPKVPIHWIGGIAGETKHYEVKGFVRALKGHKAIGGSYYDFSITTPEEWSELQVIAGRKPPTRGSKNKHEPKRADKKHNDRDKKHKKKRDKKHKDKAKKKHKKAKRKDGKKWKSGKHDKRTSHRRGKKANRRKDAKKRELSKKKRRSRNEEIADGNEAATFEPRLLWPALL